MNLSRRFSSRPAWPPLWSVLLFLAIYGLFNGGLLLINARLPKGAEVIDNREFRGLNTGLLCLAAGMFACYRVFRFHPAVNRNYATWLMSAPWAHRKPLPAGPVHPVMQDVVVLSALAAVGYWHAGIIPLLPPMIYLLIYLIIMTILLGVTRERGAFFGAAFLWPALILPQLSDGSRWALLALLVGVIAAGFYASLRRFPWSFLAQSRVNLQGGILQTEVRIELKDSLPIKVMHRLGWPYAVLSPKPELTSISTSNALLISGLLGWVYFCIVEATSADRAPALPIVFGCCAAIYRLILYSQFNLPPFNVLGRFSSGQLILPGYDKIFVAPLLAIAIAFAGARFVRLAGSAHHLVEAVTIALVMFVLLGMGPRLQEWVLTGKHRFARPARMNSRTSSLKEV